MIKLYLDTSDINEIKTMKDDVHGFTTNPTLMRKVGVTDYEKFAKEVLSIIDGKPVSFEVLADDFDEMERQARKIASWGENIYVKIPITNTKDDASVDLIDKLSDDGIKVNVTAITNHMQMIAIGRNVMKTPKIVSIFAGRIADTGVDPMNIISGLKGLLRENEELLWASPREVFNIQQAMSCGADIITLTPELLRKYRELDGKNLDTHSLDTVKMFYEDGLKAGYKL